MQVFAAHAAMLLELVVIQNLGIGSVGCKKSAFRGGVAHRVYRAPGAAQYQISEGVQVTG